MSDSNKPEYIEQRKAPSVVATVSPDSDEFKKFISNEYGYVTALINPTPEPGRQFEWHDLQRYILATPTSTLTNKCRQSGGSYVMAARAYARANLINRDWAIVITSIKKDEAQNKISYIDGFLESMPPRFKRKVKYRTKQSIEIENRDGSTVKIISHAQKESRGLHGDHIMDEVEFWNDFERLFSAAQPGTRMVGGRMDIISTPWDPEGHFRKMIDYREYPEYKGKYAEFTRFKATWWVIPFYTNDYGREQVVMPDGRKVWRSYIEAPSLTTEERVYKFGTQRLIDAYENSLFETFRREYEAVFVMENAQFFPLEDIRLATCRDIEDLRHEDFSGHWDDKVAANDTGYVSMTPIESILMANSITPKVYGRYDDEESITELLAAMSAGVVGPLLYLGMDVGRTGDATDLVIYEEIPIEGVSYIVERFWLSKTDWPLPDQQLYIERVLRDLPIYKFGIDTNGIGWQLGDYFTKQNYNNFVNLPFNSANVFDRTMGALSKRFKSRTIGISSYKEVQTAISGVYRESVALEKSRWKLSRKNGGHSDSAVSRAIVAALVEEYSYFATGYNPKSITKFERSEISKPKVIIDPFSDPVFSRATSGSTSKIMKELTVR